MGSHFLVSRENGTLGQNTSLKAAAFDKIYATNKWGGVGGSGPGSSFLFTIPTRCVVQYVIDHYRVGAVFDSSCGDFTWLRFVIARNPDVFYAGNDVSDTVVNALNAEFASQTNWSFTFRDLSSPIFEFPRTPNVSGKRLILSRQAMQHNKVADVLTILENINNSGWDYLLASTYTTNSHNTLQASFGSLYNRINLQESPYNLPKPLEIFAEHSEDSLALWKLPLV